jgi:hypothetical protein
MPAYSFLSRDHGSYTGLHYFILVLRADMSLLRQFCSPSVPRMTDKWIRSMKIIERSPFGNKEEKTSNDQDSVGVGRRSGQAPCCLITAATVLAILQQTQLYDN